MGYHHSIEGTCLEGLLGKRIEVELKDFPLPMRGWLHISTDERPMLATRSNSSKGKHVDPENIKTVKVLKSKANRINDKDNRSFRIATAARIILSGGPKTGQGERKFSSCFEMGDADEVLEGLLKRAEKNQKLDQLLPQFITSEAIRETRERMAARAKEEKEEEMNKGRVQLAAIPLADNDKQPSAWF